jgi:hypothetical protein
MYTRYGNGFVNVRAINPKVSCTSHAKIQLYIRYEETIQILLLIDNLCDFVSILCFWVFDVDCGSPSTFPILCESLAFSKLIHNTLGVGNPDFCWYLHAGCLRYSISMFQRSFTSRPDVSQPYIDDSMGDRMEMVNVNDRYSQSLSIISQWQPKDLR